VKRRLRQHRILKAVFLPALLLFFSAVSVEAQSEDPVSLLLFKMGTADLQTSYRGDKTILNLSSYNPKVYRFVITHAPPNFESRRFREGASVRGAELFVSDGKYLWQYFPHRHLVVRRPIFKSEGKKESAQRMVDLTLKNYTVDPPEEGPLISGRASLVLGFVPRFEPKRPRRKIWIDREKGIPLRTEIYGLNNQLSLVSYFESIVFDPATKPEQFVLKVPPGTMVRPLGEVPANTVPELDSMMGVKILLPRSMPRGFSLLSLHMNLRNGVKVAHLQYTDGLSTLSLFETTGKTEHQTPEGAEGARSFDVGGTPGTLYNLGLLRMVHWQAEDLHLTVVGELAEDDLIHFARSLAPQSP